MSPYVDLLRMNRLAAQNSENISIIEALKWVFLIAHDGTEIEVEKLPELFNILGNRPVVVQILN